MKSITILFFSLFGLGFPGLSAQDMANSDSTGLPGDHFSLEGALALFKQAGSPEEFEKMLNEEQNHVNNLDLDRDGQTDYIRVIEKMDGDNHAFVLQAIVNATENQDIAVIELEKNGAESAMLQIVGDEDIFGEQTIVEPESSDENSWVPLTNENYSGPNDQFTASDLPGVIVNVWFWPCVRFVYSPGYRVWISPWRWRAYPAWWRPWRPLGWAFWRPYRLRYHTGFVVVRTHRVIRAHRIYTPVRVRSVAVRTRYAGPVNNYRVTRTRTTVTGPAGNKVIRKTTTVTGPGGKVKARKTTVRRKR